MDLVDYMGIMASSAFRNAQPILLKEECLPPTSQLASQDLFHCNNYENLWSSFASDLSFFFLFFGSKKETKKKHKSEEPIVDSLLEYVMQLPLDLLEISTVCIHCTRRHESFHWLAKLGWDCNSRGHSCMNHRTLRSEALFTELVSMLMLLKATMSGWESCSFIVRSAWYHSV